MQWFGFNKVCYYKKAKLVSVRVNCHQINPTSTKSDERLAAAEAGIRFDCIVSVSCYFIVQIRC